LSRNIKSKIIAYALILAEYSPTVQALNGVPLANLITDLFTQLRELEAVSGQLIE
jgi:hypothetical protein